MIYCESITYSRGGSAFGVAMRPFTACGRGVAMELFYEELIRGAAVRDEWPGVRYVCAARREGRPTEYYVIERACDCLPDEAKQYAKPFADRPDLLWIALDDPHGGRAIVDYEITKRREPGSAALLECAELAAELHPAYFGTLLPPRRTPCGETLRWRALMNGVYLHETESGQPLLSVCPPLTEEDISDYSRRHGQALERCLFFDTQSACVPLFELAQSYPALKNSPQLDWHALMTAIWKHHPAYAISYNLKSSGSNQTAAAKSDNMIAISTEQRIKYLFFCRDATQ